MVSIVRDHDRMMRAFDVLTAVSDHVNVLSQVMTSCLSARDDVASCFQLYVYLSFLIVIPSIFASVHG